MSEYKVDVRITEIVINWALWVAQFYGIVLEEIVVEVIATKQKVGIRAVAPPSLNSWRVFCPSKENGENIDPRLPVEYLEGFWYKGLILRRAIAYK